MITQNHKRRKNEVVMREYLKYIKNVHFQKFLKICKIYQIDQRERNQKKNSEVYANNNNSKHRDRFKKSLNKVKIHQ